ncbi:MAG TPA: hypothetical protein VI039_01235 [Solirubrobacterales bacterium]
MQEAQIAGNLKALLPKAGVDLAFVQQRIPALIALKISGGPNPPKTNKEAEERVDRLWSELGRLMDEELLDEIAVDEIVEGETTAEACVGAAKHIFRAKQRDQTWRYSTLDDKRSITTLRAEAYKKLRPEAGRKSRELFEDNYEWPILLALARLLLRVEGQGSESSPASWRKAALLIAAAVTTAAAVAILVVVFATRSPREVYATNPGGEIERTVGLPSGIEDLSVAAEFTWVASSQSETALRVDQGNEIQETFDIGLPSPPIQLPEDLPNGSQWGGYQIAGGDFRAWVVTTTGTVAVLLPSFLGEGTSMRRVARLAANAGPAEYALGHLWVGGLTGELVSLDASTGRIQKRYRLPGSLGTIDVAIGLGAAWALDFSGSKVYGIEYGSFPDDLEYASFKTLRLARPARDLAAGYGGLWVVNQDGTLARYDIETGEPEFVSVPGKAVAVAVSVGSAWVALEDKAVVRISVSDLTVAGQPIKLPEAPVAIDARHDPWVATRKMAFEIDADPAEKPP